MQNEILADEDQKAAMESMRAVAKTQADREKKAKKKVGAAHSNCLLRVFGHSHHSDL